jgi:hypothetical protein
VKAQMFGLLSAVDLMVSTAPANESLGVIETGVKLHFLGAKPVHSDPGVTFGAVHTSQGATPALALGEEVIISAVMTTKKATAARSVRTVAGVLPAMTHFSLEAKFASLRTNVS